MAREEGGERHGVWPTTLAAVAAAVESIDDNTVGEAAERVLAGALRVLTSLDAESGVARMHGYRRAIPGWRSELRAAATDMRSPVQHFTDERFGIEFIRSTADGRETQVIVTSDGSLLGVDDLVVVSTIVGSESIQLLVLIDRGGDGICRGQIVTPLLRMSDDIEITLGRPDTLTPQETASVEHAVRASTSAGRNAWRRVARRLPDGHPVRNAVLAGVSRKAL